MKLNARDRRKFIITGALFAAFLLFVILIKTVDVAAIGPEGSEVGFAKLNGAFMNLLPFRKFFYKLAEILGVLVLLVVAGFAALGGWQLFKRRRLEAVDTRILLLGVFYVIVFILYVLFDKLPINYRPVIIDPIEGLEPSFPSSHTMLAMTVLGTATMQTNYYLKGLKLSFLPEKIAKYITPVNADRACYVLMVLVILCRLLSGVHWFTDIFGGILISAALVMLYHSCLVMMEGAMLVRGRHEKR